MLNQYLLTEKSGRRVLQLMRIHRRRTMGRSRDALEMGTDATKLIDEEVVADLERAVQNVEKW